jgi:hypothetical protein
MQPVVDVGLMLDGHDTSRADALTQARAYLVDAGVDPFVADAAVVDSPGLVVQAWWSDEQGFVQDSYGGALPVTVVHVSTEGLTA